MPVLGPYLDDPAPARMPWELDPSPDESPVPDVARGFPDLPGYDQIFAPMTGPNPWDVATPDLAGVAQRAAEEIPRPSVTLGEPDVQPWDELPHEEQSTPPAVAAYDDPTEGPRPWDAHPAGTVEPGLAGSESFAPEFDANPEGAAADQAWSDVQTKQAEYSRLDPVKFAEVQALDALNRRHEEAKRQAEANETDRLSMEQSVNNRAKAKAAADRDMAEVTAKAKAMAESSPFESWWDDRSILGKFAGVIAAVAGGINNPTGPNSGLEFMVRMAEGAADQKWKKLNARRELAAGAQASADSNFQEETAIRLASYQQAIRGLETQMALYDPAGRTALKLEETKRGMVAKLAGVAQEAHDKRQAQAVKAMELDQEQQKIDNEREKWMAQERRRGMGSGARPTAGWGPADVHSGPEWMARMGLTPEMLDGAFLDAPKVTGKEFRDWWEFQKGKGNLVAEQVRADHTVQQTDLEIKKYQVLFDGNPLYEYEDDGKTLKRDKAGNPVKLLALDEQAGIEQRQKVAATTHALRKLYEIQAIRRAMRSGATVWKGTSASQQLAALQGEVVLTMKEGLQGVSSDADMQQIANKSGVGNILSMFSQEAALDQGIRNITDAFNSTMRQKYRYKGPALLVDDPYKDKQVENDMAARLTSRAGSRASASEAVLGNMDSPKAWLKSVTLQGPAHTDKATGDQKAAIDQAKATLAVKGHPDADAGAAALVAGATVGQNKDTRRKAATALWEQAEAGSEPARAAINGLSESDRAKFLVQLPKDVGWKAMKKLVGIPEAPDHDEDD